MIYSYDIEKQLLAGLIKYPGFYSEIANIISEDDFFSENSQVNRTIFLVVKSFLDKGDAIDYVLVAEKVKSLGINFEDIQNTSEYVKSLSLRKVNENGLKNIAKEFKNLAVRRMFYYGATELAKEVKSGKVTNYNEITSLIDKTLNNKISLFDNGVDVPDNIFESMEEVVEERALNPLDNIGIMSPYKRINQLYGSLFRPGNITVVVARPGVGKTTLSLDLLKKSAMPENVPVLHFDNGEMSKEELTFRMCAAEAKVPIKHIEKGNWIKNKDLVEKVRAVWPKVKPFKFYYYNVGGMSVDDMIGVARRFYYSKVGRGNEMILSFDYIKTTFEEGGDSSKKEWQVVGEMVDKFKRFIQKEIVFDKKPMISMLTAAQSNRSGITTNRNSDSIVDDESVVSLSDRIIQFASHLFLLRPQVLDELDEADFGTHILSCYKYRHLGDDVFRATQPVRYNDRLRRNCIYLDINNFDVEEKGDLNDLVQYVSDLDAITQESDPGEGVPELNFNP